MLSNQTNPQTLPFLLQLQLQTPFFFLSFINIIFSKRGPLNHLATHSRKRTPATMWTYHLFLKTSFFLRTQASSPQSSTPRSPLFIMLSFFKEGEGKGKVLFIFSKFPAHYLLLLFALMYPVIKGLFISSHNASGSQDTPVLGYTSCSSHFSQRPTTVHTSLLTYDIL